MTHKKVNFVVAGQPKSGTTALAQFLSEHPDICISYPKEPHFFATDTIEESDKFHGRPTYFLARTPSDYDRHFAHHRQNQIIGEASTGYVYSKKAAENIYKHNPKAKVIIMLRNPVDFIYSLHMQYVNEAVENEKDFENALKLEEERKKGRHLPPKTRCPSFHFYRERVKYYEQVKRYLDIFPKEQIFVVTAEEFKKNNKKVYKEILGFLDVDRLFTPEFKSVHDSKKPRLLWMNDLIHTLWLKRFLYKIMGPKFYTRTHKKVNKILLKRQPRKEMNLQLKKTLEKELEPEVKKTSELLNKDLGKIWGY